MVCVSRLGGLSKQAVTWYSSVWLIISQWLCLDSAAHIVLSVLECVCALLSPM